MLLHFFLLLSSASSLSQTGRDEQTLAGESNTCDKSIAVNSDTCHKIISGDSDKSEEGQHKVVNSCHRRENDVDAEEEKTVLGSSSMEEEKKMEWKEFDWAAYQALDINPADQEEPTARSTTTSSPTDLNVTLSQHQQVYASSPSAGLPWTCSQAPDLLRTEVCRTCEIPPVENSLLCSCLSHLSLSS